MFAGHYGISYLVKARDKRIPLWVLILAVQWIDMFWALFVLAGIEKLSMAPELPGAFRMNFEFLPYSHGFTAAVLWSAGVFALYWLLGTPRRDCRAALLVALAVASHWVLDIFVHRADLPLFLDGYKIGLGLWDYAVAAFLLETFLFVGGIVVYLRATKATTTIGKYGMVVFGIVVVAQEAVIYFCPLPLTVTIVTTSAFVTFWVLAGIVFWLERQRV